MVPVVHALSLLHVVICKVEITDNYVILGDVVYLRKCFDNADHLGFAELFDLAGIVHCQIICMFGSVMSQMQI